MEEELDSNKLRTLAEKRLEGKPIQDRSAEDNAILVAELTIHQEQLKVQNEELKMVQLELEATKANYFELYDLAPVGYITLNTDLIIKEANLAASRLLGMDRAHLINSGISRFVRSDLHESLYLHYRRLADGNGEPVKTFVVKHGDGSEIQVQFESNLIHNGHVTGFRSILTDVTELKRTREALQQANNGLAHSKLELQQFAYIASHDLQEPLRMVISYLTLLEKRYGDRLDADGKEFIEFAVSGGKRMRELIDDLLEYSRIESRSKPFVLVDMKRVVGNTIRVLKVPIDESNADIIIEPMPTIMGDGSQMQQVMQNLISNSLKFHGPERPVVRISAIEGRKEWTFSVKDNGIGLNVEYADKIFQMFQRLHAQEQYTGTGVGLAITKKIVERHGGRIWVESEEGKGATFFFTIPNT